MMKLYYVGSVMREDDFSTLFANTATMPGQQGPKFNRLLIQGLDANNVDVHVICGVPITQENYRSKVYRGKAVREGHICYDYLPTLNLPGIKNLLNLVGAFVKVLLSRKADAVICDVLNASVSLGAALAAKLRRKSFVGIVTDLPHLMVTGCNQKHCWMVEQVMKNCTHFILLTEQMNEVVNPSRKPYIIIEGICDREMEKVHAPKRVEKRCIYAGLLDVRYGVKAMVEAFLIANVEGAELHIFGNGAYAEELAQVAEQHENIVYHGNVLNTEVVKAELEASLLINPRPTDEEFTKYSFPSKNLEYMASGTAVLTTNLPGMPDEYRPYVYLFDDESIEGMANTMKALLCSAPEVIHARGESARQFVMKQKNNMEQAQKVIQLIIRG